MIILTVHMVLCYILHLYRPEGTKSHMQRDITNLHALLFDFLQQLRRKVKPCSWCGGTAKFTGIYSLVAFSILQFFLDVGWKRHLAKTFENLEKDAVIMKLNDSVPAFCDSFHRRCQFPISELKLRTGFGFTAGTTQAFPAAIPQVAQENKLHAAPGTAAPEKPGRQHACVVQHKTIACMQVFRKLIKVAVFNLACDFVQVQHTGSISLLKRCLSDQFFRQITIEI